MLILDMGLGRCHSLFKSARGCMGRVFFHLKILVKKSEMMEEKQSLEALVLNPDYDGGQ